MNLLKLLAICALSAGASLLCYGFAEDKTKLMSFGAFLFIAGGISCFVVF